MRRRSASESTKWAEPADVFGRPEKLEPEQKLWLSALELALSDAARSAGRASSSETAGTLRVRSDQARRWLTLKSWSLSVALSAVGLDENFWREKCIPELRRRWRAIDNGGDITGTRRYLNPTSARAA